MIKKAMVHKGRNAAGALSIIAQHDGNILADYGKSLLVKVEESGIEELAEQQFRVREIPVEQSVQLNGFHFNPMDACFQSNETSSRSVSLPSGDGHHLLRLAGPIHADWQETLETMGVTIYEQVLTDEFLIKVDGDQIDAILSLDFVEAISPYYPALKISPQLLTTQVQEELSLSSGLGIVPLEDATEPPPANLPQGMGQLKTLGLSKQVVDKTGGNIELILFDASYAGDAVAGAEALGLTIVEQNEDRIVVSAVAELVPQLAALPQVKAINPHQPFQLHNNVAADIINAPALQNGLGLDGSNQIIAVADSGLDNGINDATILDDFEGRIVNLYALGRPGDASDPNGHGTHVAGSVLGDGSNSNGNVRGFAPNSQVVFQSLMDSGGGLGGIPSNLGVGLFDVALADGAFIHTNSWGADVDGAYTGDSSSADTFAFNNRDFLILFSAGNDAPNRIGAPGTAKNVLTIGASESLRPLPPSFDLPPSPMFPGGATYPNLDTEADATSDVAAFSSRGPAQNNRRKPDVVAPGSWILSARSSVAVADTGADGLLGTGDEDGIATHGEAVGQGLPGQPFFGGGDENTPPLPAGSGAAAFEDYMYLSGTSMATPITAGSCALLRQYLIEQRNHIPAAALIKALVVNGAMDMGQPVNEQGWGRVDLENTLFPIATGRVQFDDTLDNALASGDFNSYDVHVASSAEPLVVTLVWRDPAASTIQNQLFLRVTHVGTGATFTAETEGLPVLNNVQKVVVPAPTPGLYEIEVEALNISTGIPEFLPAIRQDYALVVANAVGFSCNPSDLVQVIDRSGSMGFYGYMEPAKQRASELVDILQINDQIGVVSFAASAMPGTPTPLTLISSQFDKDNVKLDIDAITAGGSTDLREALEDGLNTLGADAGRPRAMIFLSDGHHTVPTAAIDNAFLDTIAAANVRVYTIALGPASDIAVLNNIASRTGTGAAYSVESAADLHKLHEIYYDIVGAVGCGTVVHLNSTGLSPDGTLSESIQIEDGALEAHVMLSWGEGVDATEATLIAPSGRSFAPSSPEIRHVAGETYQLYRIAKPEPGKWTMRIQADLNRPNAQVTTAAIVESDVRCEISHKADNGEVFIRVKGFFEDRQIEDIRAIATVTFPTVSIDQMLDIFANELERIEVNKDLLNGSLDDPKLAQLNILAANLGRKGKDIFERKTVEVELENQAESLIARFNVRDFGAMGNAQIVVSAEAHGDFGQHTCTKIIPVYLPMKDPDIGSLRIDKLINRHNRLWQHRILGAVVLHANGKIATPSDDVSVDMTIRQGLRELTASMLPYYRRGRYFIWRVPTNDLKLGKAKVNVQVSHNGGVVAKRSYEVIID